MKAFLISIMPVALWVIAAINLLLTASLFVLWRRRRFHPALWMGLVAFGLFYDALILALGTVMQESGLFRILSLMRYVLHCGLIPLLFPICAEALGFKKIGMRIVWIVTAVMIAVGLAAGFVTQLEPKTVGTVLRYASADTTPAWSSGIQNGLSYGPIVVLIACGIIAWVKRKRPELFLSGFFMFAFSALGPGTGNFDLIFFISMFGEVLMAFFFWLYGKNRKGANA